LSPEVDRLTEELASRDRETEQSQDEQAGTVGVSGNESETTSVWGRTKLWFGRDSV